MNAQNHFNFELVSPEQKLVSESAFQVTMPGEEGYVGVRAGHMALMLSLKAGVVEVLTTEQGVPEKFFVAGGFADITQDQCTLLAEEAVRIETLSKDRLLSELARLNDDLDHAHDASETARITSRIALTQSMIDAVSA